jgi:hypothetical protein
MNTKPAERSSPPPECNSQHQCLLRMPRHQSESRSEANVHTTVSRSADRNSSPQPSHITSGKHRRAGCTPRWSLGDEIKRPRSAPCAMVTEANNRQSGEENPPLINAISTHYQLQQEYNSESSDSDSASSENSYSNSSDSDHSIESNGNMESHDGSDSAGSSDTDGSDDQ